MAVTHPQQLRWNRDSYCEGEETKCSVRLTLPNIRRSIQDQSPCVVAGPNKYTLFTENDVIGNERYTYMTLLLDINYLGLWLVRRLRSIRCLTALGSYPEKEDSARDRGRTQWPPSYSETARVAEVHNIQHLRARTVVDT